MDLLHKFLCIFVKRHIMLSIATGATTSIHWLSITRVTEASPGRCLPPEPDCPGLKGNAQMVGSSPAAGKTSVDHVSHSSTSYRNKQLLSKG